MISLSRAERALAAGLVLILVAGAALYVALRPLPVPPPVPVVAPVPVPVEQVVGTSVEGRAITAYQYGTGDTALLFVGGMHGGYEWNSVLLAYQFMDYLKANPTVVPSNISVFVIPVANPDGLYKVVGTEGRFTAASVSTDTAVSKSGRFNARAVDLNRNFDCNWQEKSTWQNRPVSAGTAPFSEPESQAIRKAVFDYRPAAVVFWHSQANAVYASACHAGPLAGTLAAMRAYAKAAGYPAVESFDAYPITGDSEGWLASINIPAITVELKTHETTEWEKNLAGIKALLALYGKP